MVGVGRFGGVEMRAAQFRRELKALRDLGSARLGKGNLEEVFPHPKIGEDFAGRELSRVGPEANNEEQIGRKRFVPKPIIPGEIVRQPLQGRFESGKADDRIRRQHAEAAELLLTQVDGTIRKANQLLDQAEQEISKAREPSGRRPRRRRYG